MHYKLLKGGHLSERKCRDILELFCNDLTATQIADISGVSRVTVNGYLKIIRLAVVGFCEADGNAAKKLPFLKRDSIPGKEETPGAWYGVTMENGIVFSSCLKIIRSDDIRQFCGDYSIVEGDMSNIDLEGFHALADYSSRRLYWKGGNVMRLRSLEPVEEVVDFWNFTKRRLQKFRGMNKSTLHLHIRECEFRYNFRNDDIFTVLTGIISGRQSLAIKPF